jgi:cytochrome c oxidase cbb3-type subunit 3
VRPAAERVLLLLPALALLLLLSACDREARSFREVPPTATAATAVAMSSLQPGVRTPEVDVRNRYEENAYAISEGKRLYEQWNCAGCHAHGGGGIGPALMDDEWIYGSEPENVVATIVEGRPNGMPSFRQRIPNQQLWQIAAYVRSMSRLTPKDATSGRSDHMQYKKQEQSAERQEPKPSFRPPASERP